MDNRTIVCGLRGISRQSEVLERIYGGFYLVNNAHALQTRC